MLTIKLTKKDLQEGAKYYNQQQIELGYKFKDKIKTSFHTISETPYAGSYLFDQVRYKVVDQFPYIITYTHLNPDKL